MAPNGWNTFTQKGMAVGGGGVREDVFRPPHRMMLAAALARRCYAGADRQRTLRRTRVARAAFAIYHQMIVGTQTLHEPGRQAFAGLLGRGGKVPPYPLEGAEPPVAGTPPGRTTDWDVRWWCSWGKGNGPKASRIASVAGLTNSGRR
jgi:hypothetical protein